MTESLDDVARVDEHFRRCAPGSEDERAWRRVRLALRRATRISSTAMPAMGLASQHAVAARDHAQASLDAMSGMTAGRDDETPVNGVGR